MILTSPWFLSLVLLVFIPLFLPHFRRRIKFPNAQSFQALKRKRRYSVPTVLVVMSGLAIVLAVCDPQLGFVKQEKKPLCVSVALSIDLSGSMMYQLGPVKQGVHDFLNGMKENVKNNLISLTVFSSDAYVVCPPTDDYEVLGKFVDSLSVSTLGNTTAIGRGLLASASSVLGDDVTYNYLKECAENHTMPGKTKGKVIVLFTDGHENMGIKMVPVLELMAEMEIRVYYIQTGHDLSGTQQQLIRDTGGDYYQLDNLDDIGEAYQAISLLEKDRTTVVTYEERKRLYTYFVLLGLILFSGGVVLRECLFLRI